jgi:membrane associated rhomboid family serine protease
MNTSYQHNEDSEANAGQQDEWVLLRKTSWQHLADFSLVLSAVGIDHQLDSRKGLLLVRRHHSALALAQLQAFEEENQNWPPPPSPVPPSLSAQHWPTLFLLTALVFFFTKTGPWTATSPWFLHGAVNSSAILEQGQWWRLLTALTLHADEVHLAGNCVIGGLMVHLLCKTLGYGTGWLTLVLCGTLGNLMNIALRAEPHYSVGFSTAIFAAIGLFCGRQMQSTSSSLIRQLLLPLGAGIGLLAMLGAGSEGGRTDLGAHFFGLATGLLGGFIVRKTGMDLHGKQGDIQAFLFILTLFLILGAWILAF